MIHYIAEMFRANYHCDKHPVTSRVFADPVVAGVVDLDTAVVAGIVDPGAARRPAATRLRDRQAD